MARGAAWSTPSSPNSRTSRSGSTLFKFNRVPASAIQSGRRWGSGALDVSEIRSERLRQVYAYWRSKIVDGRLPSRASIDPLDIPSLLPFVFLVDVESNPRRFRFRLVGTQVCLWAGRDVTGMYADDPAYGPRGPDISRQYAEVVERRAVLYSERPAARPDRDHMFYDRLVLPLAGDGRTIDLLLCALDKLAPTPALREGRFREVWGSVDPK